MKERPRVTVLVPTFNRAQFLGECLDSLFDQTLPPFQVLVVDDGSTDGTRGVFEPYRDRAEYIPTPQVGKPAAINEGLKKVRGEYLWIFDDDDVALPDALDRFVEPLLGSERYGFSYSSYFFTPSAKGGHRIGKAGSELVIPDVQRDGFLVCLLENNFLGGAALFARTACYQKVGLFDESLLRSQDYDMAIRIAREYEGVRIAGGATFHYRQHGELRGNTRDRFVAGKRLRKWLEYDQMIFKKLFKELSLQDYLPAGADLDKKRRQALLQRMAVMANKLLVEEALSDLRDLQKMGQSGPFTEDEERIIRLMSQPPYYRTGNILDEPGFVRYLSDNRARSAVLAALFAQMMRELYAQFAVWRGIRALGALTVRLIRLSLSAGPRPGR